jgi:hypothetical protein
MRLQASGWLAIFTGVLLMPVLALAQPAGGAAGAQGGGGRGRGGGNQTDFYKELLGASDEEWSVIQPRLQKVIDLRTSLNRAGFGGRGGGGRGGGRGGGGQNFQTADDAVTRALTELQSAIDNTSSTPEMLSQRMATFRAAREKATADLAIARKALKEILTTRQEAVLLLANILE